MIVTCPNCKIAVKWTSENLFKPFCCERCKLIDLGEWFFEEKLIAGEEIDIENQMLLLDYTN